jgi:hypothetical protein
VPEFEEREFVPVQVRGKRFKVAAAWWQWDKEGEKLTVRTADRSASATVAVPASDFGGDEQGVIWHQAFPAGKGRMALVFYMQGITFQSTSTETISEPYRTSSWVRPELIAEAQAYIEWYNTSGPGAGSPLVRPKAEISQSQPPFSIVADRAYSETYSNVAFAVVLQCFIVTDYFVQAIDCPEPLRQSVKNKYYYALNAFMDPISSTGTGGTAYVLVSTVFQNQQETETPLRTFSESVSIQSDQRGGLRYQYANTNNYQDDPATWLVLLRSYGYGKLLNRPNGQDPAWGWTPAAFAFLKNYTGEFHGTTQEQPRAYDYGYIAQQYFPRDSPAIMLEADYKTDPTNVMFYHWFRAPLIGANFKTPTAFNVPPIQPRQASGPIQQRVVPVASQYDDEDREIWRDGIEVPAVTWDWGRPLACILELQSLGFTAEDLMLTPEETAALAAADPAEVGFKF